MSDKKIIFLDVDGVLNNINFWKKNYFKYGFSAGTYSIDERNVRTLAKLHRKLKDKYEILSSYYFIDDALDKMLKENNEENKSM